MDLRITLDDAAVQAGLARMPQKVIARVEAYQERGAATVARAARIKAAERSIFGTLALSVIVEKVAQMWYRVRTGTNYARAVEEGTGPAAGRDSYMPNRESLLQYLRHAPRLRGFDLSRPGSRARRSQERELRDRSWGWALWIRKHGTKAHPFMAPALDEHRQELIDGMRLAAIAGAREALGQ